MSVSDNSTIAPSSDIDGSFQSLDERAEDRQPGNEVGVAKKLRRTRRPPRSTAAANSDFHLDSSETVKQGDHGMLQEGESDEAIVSYEKSPYADAAIVFLHVGSDATPFSVHGTVLMKSSVLAARYDSFSMVKQHVPIPEVDEATAHTLVHYLYTDNYQGLCAPSQSGKPAISSYKVGTCVYCAAVRYKLPGLAELAKEKITSFGMDVSISDILTIARDDAFPLLPEDETWYPTYLGDAVKSAMAEDPEPFRRPDFITHVEGNSRLLQVVWKTVMSNYASTPVAPKVQNDKMSSPTMETWPAEIALVNNQETEKKHVTLAVGVQDPASIDEPQPVITAHGSSPEPPSMEIMTASDAPLEDPLKLDDIEPTLDPHQAPEPFTDELGFESSKMYQKMGRKDPGTESQASPDSEPERQAHKRSDSAMQVEDAVTTPLGEDTDEVMKIGDSAPLVVNGSNETSISPKKSKKSKKKKSSIVF